MFYGGTNFGRTAGYTVTTAYANGAMVDSYGLKHEPNYGYFQTSYAFLSEYADELLSKSPSPVAVRLGETQEVFVYPLTVQNYFNYSANFARFAVVLNRIGRCPEIARWIAPRLLYNYT